MSTSVTYNGTVYAIPAAGELNWSALAAFLIDVGNTAGLNTSQKQAMRVATTSPVTVSSTTDCVVMSKLASAGAVAVTLPAGVNGQWFVIGDQTGDAATNNITITPNGAETINGSATYVIAENNGCVILAYSSTNTKWNVVARFTSGSFMTNPMATTGDMVYGGASGVSTKLATGATTGLLHGGNGAVPTWSQLVNADVSSSAAIAYSKLSLGTSIVNADISASAAIVGSKLAAATSSLTGTVSFEGTGTATITWSGGLVGSTTATLRYARVGSIVTLVIGASGGDTTTGGAVHVDSTTTVVPSGYRPAVNVNSYNVPLSLAGAGATQPGMVIVDTAGNLKIYKENGSGTYSNVTWNYSAFSISYTV